MKLLKFFTLLCDAPQPWGVYYEDSASPQMEALLELHDNIMFYLVIILFGVAWIMVSIIRNYVCTKSPISNKYLNYGTLIELIWTITPALILILIAFPSFKFLYLMDEAIGPSLEVLVVGHQWYWSYKYPDICTGDVELVEFDPYVFTCPHQDNGTCGACLSLGESKENIAQCSHSWGKLNFDSKLLGSPCDFSSVRHSHPVATRLTDVVRYCKRCHAIVCKNCYAG